MTMALNSIWNSNRDSLNLIECNLIARSVIQLRRARTLVRRHRLGIFERAACFEVGRYPGRSERMAPDPDSRAEIGSAALDHAPCVDTVHRLVGQRAGATGGGAEQGSLAVVADDGGLNVGIKVGFEIVMRRHFMALAAFLVQPDPPALALGIVVLDAHGDVRA